MRKASRCTSRRQRGAALVESLVGMLVLGLAVMGSLMMVNQSLRTQHVHNARAQVMDQIRENMLGGDAAGSLALCGTNLPLTGNQSVSRSVTCQTYDNVTVTLPGDVARAVPVASTEAQILSATVDSPAIGGAFTVTSAR